MFSHSRFLFLVLALLASFSHTSEAFAGPGFSLDALTGLLSGNAVGGKGEGGAVGGGVGKGVEDEADADEAEVEEDSEFSFMSLVCGSEAVASRPIVQTICDFAFTFLKSRLSDALGGDEEGESSTSTTTDDATDDGGRKLRG